MIARVSEKPFWGPEEQIRRFINQHDSPDLNGELKLNDETVTQQTITQKRIANLDDIFQKQLIWSYGKSVDDAYFYWDWCPSGTGDTVDDPVWQIAEWYEYRENLARDMDRTFDFMNGTDWEDPEEEYNILTEF